MLLDLFVYFKHQIILPAPFVSNIIFSRHKLMVIRHVAFTLEQFKRGNFIL